MVKHMVINVSKKRKEFIMPNYGNPDRKNLGPGGECICTKCKTRVPHKTGKPCYKTSCPNCGAKMTRIK